MSRCVSQVSQGSHPVNVQSVPRSCIMYQAMNPPMRLSCHATSPSRGPTHPHAKAEIPDHAHSADFSARHRWCVRSNSLIHVWPFILGVDVINRAGKSWWVTLLRKNPKHAFQTLSEQLHGCGRSMSLTNWSLLEAKLSTGSPIFGVVLLGIHQTLSPHCMHDMGTNPRGLDGGCQLSYSCKVQLQWNGCMWGNMTWKQPTQDCHFLRMQMSHAKKTQLIGKNFPP